MVSSRLLKRLLRELVAEGGRWLQRTCVDELQPVAAGVDCSAISELKLEKGRVYRTHDDRFMPTLQY